MLIAFMLSVIRLIVFMLSVIMLSMCHFAECYYAECHYADCFYDECHYSECLGVAKNASTHKSFETRSCEANQKVLPILWPLKSCPDVIIIRRSQPTIS